MLNIDQFFFSDLFATCFLGFMAFITLFYYNKSKYPHLKYLAILWIAVTMANLVFTLSNLFLYIPLYQVFFAILCVEVFCTILFVDFLSRESIDPLKTAICAFLSGFLIISALDSSLFYYTTYPGGEKTISFSGEIIEPLFLVISAYWGAVLLIFSIHVFKESPKNLKFKAFLTVIAVFVILIRGMFSWQFNSISPLINTLLFLIGFGTLGIIFIQNPQLAFILPMKVIRLNVFDTRSGVTLFTHDWHSDINVPLINEVLFSGMLHGLNSILKEAVNKGNVHEIHLDNAVLLLNHVRDTPILFVLVATKTSKSLRKALGLFSHDFLHQFANIIPHIDMGGTDISVFNDATYLVKQTFPFVPDYITTTYEVGVIAPNIGYVCIGAGEKNLVIIQESSALITPVTANPSLIFKIYHQLIPNNYKVWVLGYDTKLPPDYPHEKTAEIYASFIEKKMGGKAIVAAISYGGFIAIPMAALYPQVVEKLFLVVTAHSISEEGKKIATFWKTLAEQGKVFTLYVRFRDIILVKWMRWFLRLFTILTYRRDRKWDNDISTFLNGYNYLLKTNGQNKRYLSQIQAPTVIFAGTKDQFFSQTDYEETAKLTKGQLIKFPNYGHYFPIEHMKEFKAKLLMFL